MEGLQRLEDYRGEIEDSRAVDFAKWYGRASGLALIVGASTGSRGDGDGQYRDADVDAARVGAALAWPPGLGGFGQPPGSQLIALMEHVAAVRRLARRGWRMP